MNFDTTKVWEIRLELQAMAKQSMRIGRGAGGRPMAFTAPKTRNYVNLLTDLMQDQKPEVPFEGPLQIEVVTCLPFNANEKKPVLARGWRFKDTQPDWDNYCKPYTCLSCFL